MASFSRVDFWIGYPLKSSWEDRGHVFSTWLSKATADSHFRLIERQECSVAGKELHKDRIKSWIHHCLGGILHNVFVTYHAKDIKNGMKYSWEDKGIKKEICFPHHSQNQQQMERSYTSQAYRSKFEDVNPPDHI